jgi:hypothetical protein
MSTSLQFYIRRLGRKEAAERGATEYNNFAMAEMGEEEVGEPSRSIAAHGRRNG